jgi:hypothetical protein
MKEESAKSETVVEYIAYLVSTNKTSEKISDYSNVYKGMWRAWWR